MALDPCSFSRPDLCAIQHIDFDLIVDFEKQVISGSAHLTVEKKSKEAHSLILDTNGLKIVSAKEQATGQQLLFTLANPVKAFGSKLEITLPASANKLTVSIEYSTSPSSSALQWLRPEQTAGKRQPYLFSQCQAIHARSVYPCQDTPGVKFTYKAKVRAPRDITILMSAVRVSEEPSEGGMAFKTHHFHQTVPIPSYLLAIVGGDLESRDIGPCSKVWSEKELVDKAAYEFAETDIMLKTAEALLGPYEWHQYDLLVLPPSFPYGGMENPCLTFVTPTILAGDRSLADVVAHEIAHSWTGNLVTNSTFQDFWLNEGHTVFVERKITSQLRGGKPLQQFLLKEGWHTLLTTVDKLQKGGEGCFTKLVPNLTGVDPDDSFSSVPYEKGCAFLTYLENLLGGPEVYEPFLKAYVKKFRFQSINTQQWKDFLFSYFSSEADQAKLNSVDWDMWLYAEGMPTIQPQFDTSLVAVCEALSKRWLEADADLESFSKADLKEFSTLQVREFLSLLLQSCSPTNLTFTKLQTMDKLYQLSGMTNSEILFRWIHLGVKLQWMEALPRALKFVNEQGRMKFVRPIYSGLYEWEGARQAAMDNFLKHRPEMNNITAKEVAKDLHLDH